jgi:hypothetical protein
VLVEVVINLECGLRIGGFVKIRLIAFLHLAVEGELGDWRC